MAFAGVAMQRFERLRVWQEGHQFALAVYRASARFPRSEIYGLTAQLRRAATSVPTNVAEGSTRIGRKDYAHFLNIAEASAAESLYLAMLSRDLGYVDAGAAATLIRHAEGLCGMLFNLRKRVERNDWLPGSSAGPS